MANEIKAKDIKLANLVDALNENATEIIKSVARRQPMAVLFLAGLTPDQRNVFKGFPDWFSIRRLETAVCEGGEELEDEEAEEEEEIEVKAKKAPAKKAPKKAPKKAEVEDDDDDDFDDEDDEDEPAPKKKAKKAPAKKSKKAEEEEDDDDFEDFA